MNVQVARKLYERLHRSSPVLMTGDLLNVIGSDGLSEALQNRWLIPDQDTGFLRLNTDGGKMLELESACLCACGQMTCACTPAAEQTSTSMPMREAFAAFGVTRPSGGGSSPTGTPAPSLPLPRAQAASAPTHTADKTSAPQIGDEAMVTDNGKAYTGRVATIGQDGRMKLSFGQDHPSMDREYASNEMRITPQA